MLKKFAKTDIVCFILLDFLTFLKIFWTGLSAEANLNLPQSSSTFNLLIFLNLNVSLETSQEKIKQPICEKIQNLEVLCKPHLACF